MTLGWILENGYNLAGLAALFFNGVLLFMHRYVPSRKEFNGALGAVRRELDGKIQALDERVDEQKERLDRGEEKLATKDDVTKILVALAHQDGERGALSAQIEGIKALVAGMQNQTTAIIQDAIERAGRTQT